MTEATLKKVAVGGLVIAVTAMALSLFTAIKRNIFTTGDDQPVTLGGGSLHLRPFDGWTVNGNTSTYTSRADYYMHVDWACSSDDAITTSDPTYPATVSLLYKGQGKSHTLTFTIASARLITLTIKDQDTNYVGATMLRHLFVFGQHAKGSWKLDGITSTNLARPITGCNNKNDGDFFLQFKP